MADLKPTCDDLCAEYRNILPGISAEQTKQIEAAIKAGNFLEAASVVQTFKNLSGVEFNIAITGESGSGKSSLVNAIRGLAEEDEGAAVTSVLEMTKEPVPYCHPTCPMVTFWDLPAIGTPDFRPDAYLKQVKFSRYDVFIIIASERSRFCHTKLAREIQKMGKKFFFVRSKVDLDLYYEESKQSVNEERILEKIRNDCVNNLSRVRMRSPRVFLVSSREFQKYDSPQLQKTLLKEFYNHKMEMIRATEAPRGSGEMADLKPTCDDLCAEYRNILPGMPVEQTKQIEAAIKAGNFLEAASVVQTFKNLSGVEFNIAITGESGSGKSSLLNAIRGLVDEDEGAAETGVVEMTKEPVPYRHPTCPMVIYWDLPAIGTPHFRPDAYLKQVKFSRYDVFIIIASERSRFCHTKLAREIQKMGKKFFFVRSKVDLDLYNEESKESVNEERTLEKIRNDCVNNLSRVGMSSPRVFLVSSREFQKYDFPQLQKTLLKELYHHKPETFETSEAPRGSGEVSDLKPTCDDPYEEYRNILPGISAEQTKQIEAAIQAGNFLEAASVVQTFKNLSGIEFNIAITGESGSGKSSLVNAIRGLGDEDEGAAETGVLEMTKEPVPYCLPTCPMVIFWDLPMIGSPDFRPDAYLKQVKFSRYDVFIIIASERSRFCHTKLAREIQKMGKKFFFVRSKVDLDLYNEKHKKSFNEERTLEKIRNDCINNLSREGMSSSQVFLVSSREFQKYNSLQLQKTLLKELYNHKPETFVATEAPRGSGKMADLKPTCDDLYPEYRNILPGISAEQTKQIEAAIQAGNFLEAASVVQTFNNLSGVEFNIAIMGESGSGKSSLVNAIRGLRDRDKGAAETGVLQMTKKPVQYCHPTCPMANFWDLPAIGTPDFRPDAYLKQVKFSRFDVFIIIVSERSRFCLTELAREITRMGKKFFFVRSKVDLDLYTEKHKKSFNAERTLENIRTDCIKKLLREGMNSPQVFLVSSREFQKYDSLQLQKTLLKEFYHHKTETFRATEAPKSSRIVEDSKTHWAGLFSKWSSKLPGLSEEETEEFQTAVKAGNLSRAFSVVKKSDELLTNIKINIAITGNTGSGKSSFINAIRSLNDDDSGAAETGLTEKKKTPYSHPKHPNVILWDLPGIGTTNCPAETYLKDMNFDQYDFFIIVAAGRFTEADTNLAKEISRMGKKFYFVRSKVDVDLANEQRKRDFKEEKTLEAIKSDCMEQLQKAGIISPQVFLVSRWDFDKYDFPQLQEVLANELDTHRRHVLICALPNTSEEILKEKQKALQEQIWKQALKSCALAAVPLPFLSVKCDVNILVENMRQYCQCFGLDEDSLKSLAKQVGKSVAELKSVIKSALAKDITRDEALKQLSEATGDMMKTKYFISVVPLIGTGIAAKRSYSVTYEMLRRFLGEVAEDAQRVLKKALEGAGNNQ